jgi:hypothetical protein
MGSVRKSWGRSHGDDGFEAALRRHRPEPNEGFLESLELRAAEASRRARGRRMRVGFAAAVVVGMLTALASVGGLSHAANATQSAVEAFKHVVAPAKSQSRVQVLSLSSGGDQYRPGFGFGDDNHNHTGPPGLKRGKNGEGAPPIRARRAPKGNAFLVSAPFTIDEQAHLNISVFDADGNPLMLVQKSKNGGPRLGGLLQGNDTKSLRYQVLVPRTIPMTLRIPGNLIQPGKTYTIRIAARDPDGNKSTLTIPFTA